MAVTQGKKTALFTGPHEHRGHKKAGPASLPAPPEVLPLDYFLAAPAEPAEPLPLKYLKNSELESTTITSPLSLNVAR